MISPYVRRRRLAAELLRLREEHGYSTQRLAKEINVPRQRISQLQNGHLRPDLDEIMRILKLFNVGERRWQQIMTIAREAQERGWWEKFRDEMGPRQALYADLEAGARSIVEYQMTLLPGLLQIPRFTEVRARADRGAYPEDFDPARALEARAIRQRVLERAGGPSYEVIIDELAVRRFAAPPDVVRAQMDHLVHVGRSRKRITIRVLPLMAAIAGHVVPRSAFFTYRYPDPGDPIVVAVDTVTSDLVLTEPAEITYYLDLYQRLQQATLSPADSLDLLAAVAEDLPNYSGSRQ
ncbi:helix-turn-helix transcriptional regulator [Micromonospora sp. Llam7]|uniref:helix-turn-helix domain-containing protein n=1 Tax=Micromonospora tarapacensis TaxID=2835305 RepID=UPI001C829CA4|nr:helix-turn-helix transcriptional regulator [Micromonospora tarapacensis]MBX7267540.1 helix-turn-helix transcriptional regulator [Micromonospora tarapacensis]